MLQDGMPDSLLGHYRALSANAADCISCHACEQRCPFGVKVADKMAKAAVLFGSDAAYRSLRKKG